MSSVTDLGLKGQEHPGKFGTQLVDWAGWVSAHVEDVTRLRVGDQEVPIEEGALLPQVHDQLRSDGRRRAEEVGRH